MEAQYNTLRQHGHTPSEAFNETVEELTQSLIRLVGQNGMDWMYANCSATAQRYVMKNISGGSTTIPMRPIQVVAFSEMWKLNAMMSFIAARVSSM